MNPTQIKRNVHFLTQDPERQAKLRRKLDEYDARLAANPSDADSVYKAGILRQLLSHGVIDPEEMERAFAAYAWHDRRIFRNAVDVIACYNGPGDEGVTIGGTGLR